MWLSQDIQLETVSFSITRVLGFELSASGLATCAFHIESLNQPHVCFFGFTGYCGLRCITVSFPIKTLTHSISERDYIQNYGLLGSGQYQNNCSSIDPHPIRPGFLEEICTHRETIMEKINVLLGIKQKLSYL